MSHFTVLVIGNNPEELLAPYHEFECTGIDDQYVQDVDITAEVQSHIDQYNSFKEGLEYHGLEDRIVSSETDVDKEYKHKYGYAIVQDGKLIKAIDRTNPNAKWDWYQLGGRWSGYFKLKSGATGIQGERSLIGVMSGQPQPQSTTADQAFKKDIDFESMINEAGLEAQSKYEQVMTAFGGTIPKLDYLWENIVDSSEGQFKDMTIDQKREFYHNQPAMKLLVEKRKNNKDLFGFWFNLKDYQVSKEEYVESARNSALSTFAVIKDGKWYEKGKMGWWACVSNEKDQKDWNKEFTALVSDLPEDTLLSIYDCHI